MTTMGLAIPEILVGRMSRPVAIFGAGVSGAAAARLVAAAGCESVTYDRTGAAFGEPEARGHGLVVYSPGFPADHPWLEVARKAGGLCLGELDFASLFWRGPIVAITGTNGKTTLTEFLAHALNAAGRDAFATGNIGRAFSDLVAEHEGGDPTEVAVCEVSSFQAERLGHFCAGAVLWTNLAEDHLERHGSMRAYFNAKWELVRHSRAGQLFVGSSVQAYASQFGVDIPEIARVQTEGLPADPALVGTPFGQYPQRENFVLALAWWKAQGLDSAVLYRAARSFRLGRHRLSQVGVINGIRYWNDSKGTNFHAVEAALRGFPAPVVLIAGGRAKGGDIDAFARRIAPRLRHAVLIGETAPQLEAPLGACGVTTTRSRTMAEAVQAATEAAKPSGEVLLSPGFASFDMFRSYEDRGNQFEQAVNALRGPRV
jgi:UDP-N-acetylmuramoylalanine--D-glutamate ligase